MLKFIYIPICILLLVIIFQDLKAREVSIWVFPLLLMATMTKFYIEFLDWQNLWMNVIFITVLMVSLVLYVSIKNKQLTNILKSYFGLGDVLFLFFIAPLFSARNLILYIVFGMMFSLILYLILNLKKINKEEALTVPLAGYLSIFLLGIFLTNHFLPTDIFYTDLI